jgi:hypothetical protein
MLAGGPFGGSEFRNSTRRSPFSSKKRSMCTQVGPIPSWLSGRRSNNRRSSRNTIARATRDSAMCLKHSVMLCRATENSVATGAATRESAAPRIMRPGIVKYSSKRLYARVNFPAAMQAG